MSVCLMVITDGRDEYHAASLASAHEHLGCDFDQVVRVDDPEHSLGFAGAIDQGWKQVETDWVMHLEADFVFREKVPLDRIVGVLDKHPELAQIVLKRQPVNGEECAAGGIVECHPEDFTEVRDGYDVWTEHRRFWSTNPSVYSSRFCRIKWPLIPQSEGRFTHKLLRMDPQLRFAFWGRKFADPLVTHIGDVRAGRGY